MWARFLGTIRRSSPTNALPVDFILRSPFSVKGSSVVPVWRPLRDHSVSPWRTMKTRGVQVEGMVVIMAEKLENERWRKWDMGERGGNSAR